MMMMMRRGVRDTFELEFYFNKKTGLNFFQKIKNGGDEFPIGKKWIPVMATLYHFFILSVRVFKAVVVCFMRLKMYTRGGETVGYGGV